MIGDGVVASTYGHHDTLGEEGSIVRVHL